MPGPVLPNGDSRLNRRDAYVLAGFALFLLIFFFGVLAQPGERCLGRQAGDGRNQFYGWRAYGFGEIRAGRFPLWNPYEFLGMPFVASLQSAMFYPTNWLCAALPLGRAINLGILVNLFLSGLFTYLWARRCGLKWLGAIVSAATYVFGAPQLLRIFEGHWSFLAPMPWIPCVLLCVEMLVSARFQPMAIVLGAVAVAMEWFGGNPQYAFYGGIAAVLYLAGRLWQRKGLGGRGIARAVVGFVLIYALGSALAGVQLMPALELFSVSARRGQLSYQWVAQYAFAPEGLVSFLAPDFFGSDISLRYWGRWNLWEMSAYVGVAAFGLALIGALCRGRGKALLPGAIALVCLLLAMGGDAVFYGLLPGFDLFRAQARFLCPMSLFIGLLAGLGADGIAESAMRAGSTPIEAAEKASRRLRIGLWILAAAAALPFLAGLALWSDIGFGRALWLRTMQALLSIGPLGQRQFPVAQVVTPDFKLAAMGEAGFSLLRAGCFLGALALVIAFALRARLKFAWIAAALLLLMAADAWSFGARYLETFDPHKDGFSPGAADYLRQVREPFRFARGGCFTLPPCEGMTHGFACLEGVQPNAPARFRDLFWYFQGRPRDEQRTSYSIFRIDPPLRMLNLRYLVAYASAERTRMAGLRTVYEDPQIRIDELPEPWPRAWLVHRYAVVPDGDELLKRLVRGVYYETGALFQEDPGCAVEPPSQPEPAPDIVRYEPQRVDIKVQAASAALLVLSDLYYPGWRAEVDGRAAVLRANYAMRAVAVPAGAHEVRFLYEPASFKAGVAASLAGGLATALLILLRVRSRKEGRREK